MQMCTNAYACARAVGGREAEKHERQKWINRERKRIEDSVNGNCSSCSKFMAKRLFCLSFNRLDIAFTIR